MHLVPAAVLGAPSGGVLVVRGGAAGARVAPPGAVASAGGGGNGRVEIASGRGREKRGGYSKNLDEKHVLNFPKALNFVAQITRV